MTSRLLYLMCLSVKMIRTLVFIQIMAGQLGDPCSTTLRSLNGDVLVNVKVIEARAVTVSSITAWFAFQF